MYLKRAKKYFRVILRIMFDKDKAYAMKKKK